MQSKAIIAVLDNPEAVSFINNHLDSDLSSVALQYSGKVDFNLTIVLQLLDIYKRAKTKLPSFVSQLLAIDKRSYEQATSEAIATYKAQFIAGDSLIDLTGGIGVDSLELSKSFEQIDVIERNKELHELANYNISRLQLSNVNRILDDANSYPQKQYEWAYIDPDRRVQDKRGVNINEMEPSLTELLPRLKDKVKKVYIKLSPLFDIDEVWRYFKNVAAVFILSEYNEVKEVGILLDWKKNNRLVHIKDISSGFQMDVNLAKDESIKIQTSELIKGMYLCIPSAVLAKSRLISFSDTAQHLTKHPEFELYQSSQTSEGFKCLRIVWLGSLAIKRIKSELKIRNLSQVNIVIKGSREKPDIWHKKLGTKDGGQYYLYLLKGKKKEAILCSS